MVFRDDFDALDDDIFSAYGIDEYVEEPEEDYEAMGYWDEDDEEDE